MATSFKRQLIKALTNLITGYNQTSRQYARKKSQHKKSSNKNRHKRFYPTKQVKRTKHSNRWEVCFHGTSVEAAKDIVRNGWKVGSWGSLGTGVYIARDKTMARIYSKGAIVKVKVCWGKTANITNSQIKKVCNSWCQKNGNQTMTDWALAHGYQSLTANNFGVFVARAQSAVSRSHFRTSLIRIIGVYDNNGNRIKV